MGRIVIELKKLLLKVKEGRVGSDMESLEDLLGKILLCGNVLIIFLSIITKDSSSMLPYIKLIGFLEHCVYFVFPLFARFWLMLSVMYFVITIVSMICGNREVLKKEFVNCLVTIWALGKVWRYANMTLFGAVGTMTQIMGLLFAVYYVFLSKRRGRTVAVASQANEKKLKACRKDKKYIDRLIERINNQDLKERIANEVYTYIYGAYKYKRRYNSLLFASILLPALIAMMNSSDILNGDLNKFVVSLLSMLSVVVAGIMGGAKARESWVRYREYAERAKKEIFSCVMRLGEYASLDEINEREVKLAETLESLYTEESGCWRELRNSQGVNKT